MGDEAIHYSQLMSLQTQLWTGAIRINYEEALCIITFNSRGVRKRVKESHASGLCSGHFLLHISNSHSWIETLWTSASAIEDGMASV